MIPPRRVGPGVLGLVLLAACARGPAPDPRPPASPAPEAISGEAPAQEEDAPPALMGEVGADEVLRHDPEYEAGFRAYIPEPGTVELLATSETPLEIEVVFGAWCADSTRELPHFFRILQEAADARAAMGLGELPIRLEFVAVGRSKTEPSALLAGKEIERVPTFIVRRDGREVGRIVETPVGLLEEDLVLLVLEADVGGE